MACFQKVIKIFIIALFISPASLAGDTTVIYQHNDTGKVSLRIPEPEQMNEYLKDRDYHYGDSYIPPEREGFLLRLWRKALQFVFRGFEVLRYFPLIFKIFIVAACIVIILIIAKRTRLHKLFYSEEELPSPEFKEIDPGDGPFDFDKIIGNEILKQNFRNAVRLLHLKLLKELELYEVIRISIDKTNLEYTREIKDTSIRNEFTILTAAYNKAWYGKYFLSKPEFDLLAERFHRFTRMLKSDHE